eukprot:scaffold56_cov379-Prasinococcus_capsulatus_cf.AAC.16
MSDGRKATAEALRWSRQEQHALPRAGQSSMLARPAESLERLQSPMLGMARGPGAATVPVRRAGAHSDSGSMRS